MAFTDEDRNILIRAATKVEDIEAKLNALPCEQQPPLCNREDRIAALEKSKERGVKAFVGTWMTIVAFGIKKLFFG